MVSMKKAGTADSGFYRAWSKTAKDLWRLASINDLLGRVGTIMMKKSPRTTLFTAAITSSGYLSSYLGLPGFSGLEAVAVPALVFGAMLGGGVALRVIPSAISSRLTVIAQANDLNLMEDYRKSQVLEHLDILWDRVFWYESDLRYDKGERSAERDQIIIDKETIRDQIRQWPKDLLDRLGVKDDGDIDKIVLEIMAAAPLTNKMEKSREGFVISSLFALKNALPQSSQAGRIGYKINLWEDERDGAYFDRSDTKLFEQYFGHITASDIKNEVGFGKIDHIKELPRKYSRKLWFYFITRKTAIETGKALNYLNEKYDTDSFNSQVMLWPGEENAEWLESFPGAREEVLALRKRIVTRTLGSSYADAVNVLDRMLLPTFEFATKLRFKYDPEYCDTSLDHPVEESADETIISNNIISDLTGYGYGRTDIDKFRSKAETAKRDMSLFMDYLASRHASLLNNRLVLRAVKTAFHINKGGMRDFFRESTFEAHSRQIDGEIEKAVKEEPAYTHRLIALRLHQSLAMLQRKGYMDLTRELGYRD